MIGISPLNWEKNGFCFMLWEGRTSNDIERIFVIKFDLEGKVIGKWDRDWNASHEPILDLLNFIKDNYLVLYKGRDGIFSKINEKLESHFLERLEEECLIDIEEFLGWIDNKNLVNSILEKFNEAWKLSSKIEDKVVPLKKWFIDQMYPIFKNGVN